MLPYHSVQSLDIFLHLFMSSSSLSPCARAQGRQMGWALYFRRWLQVPCHAVWHRLRSFWLAAYNEGCMNKPANNLTHKRATIIRVNKNTIVAKQEHYRLNKRQWRHKLTCWLEEHGFTYPSLLKRQKSRSLRCPLQLLDTAKTASSKAHIDVYWVLRLRWSWSPPICWHKFPVIAYDIPRDAVAGCEFYSPRLPNAF